MSACVVCQQPGAKKRCSRCRIPVYCSKVCQRKHWKAGHKQACGKEPVPQPSGARGVIAMPVQHVPAAVRADGGLDPKDHVARLLVQAEVELKLVHPPPAPESLERPCPRCEKFEIDSDDPAFCFGCGALRFCGACRALRDAAIRGAGGEDPEKTGDSCYACCLSDRGLGIVPVEDTPDVLKELLAAHPEGLHVKHAQLSIARASLGSRKSRERQKGKKLLMRLAKQQEFAPAQFLLSCLLETGRVDVLGQDFGKSVDLMRTAASQGYTPAVMELGTMYKNGHGVRMDKVKALGLLERAAAKNDAKAMCNMALLLIKGEGGVAQDRARAERIYLLSALRYQNANAQYMCFTLSQKPGSSIPKECGLDLCKASALQDCFPAMQALRAMGIFGF